LGFTLGFKNTGVPEVIVFIVFAGTFDTTPPPVKYLTVKVVLDGEIPYDLVNIKFEGEKAVVNLVFSKGKPNPTLSGLGIMFSSVMVGSPTPNCNYNVVGFNNLVANLL